VIGRNSSKASGCTIIGGNGLSHIGTNATPLPGKKEKSMQNTYVSAETKDCPEHTIERV
jgi:hypothetical protein